MKFELRIALLLGAYDQDANIPSRKVEELRSITFGSYTRFRSNSFPTWAIGEHDNIKAEAFLASWFLLGWFCKNPRGWVDLAGWRDPNGRGRGFPPKGQRKAPGLWRAQIAGHYWA